MAILPCCVEVNGENATYISPRNQITPLTSLFEKLSKRHFCRKSMGPNYLQSRIIRIQGRGSMPKSISLPIGQNSRGVARISSCIRSKESQQRYLAHHVSGRGDMRRLRQCRETICWLIIIGVRAIMYIVVGAYYYITSWRSMSMTIDLRRSTQDEVAGLILL